MKALTRSVYGGTDVLRFADVPLPSIAANELLVRVRAASINRADWFMLTGTPALIRLVAGLRRPRNPVLGRDVAGTVEAVGTDVRQFRPGDEVYAEITTGSFAEYARVPASSAAHKPRSVGFAEAATVPLAGTTALRAMQVAKVEPGARVLVNGASGGVGTFAVQIAAALGAEVTGVCSARNVDLVRSLGATAVIDHTAEDFTAGIDRFDVIVDLVGNRPLRACRRVLAPRGVLLLSSGNGGRVTGPMMRMLRAMAMSPLVGQRLVVLTVTPGREPLETLTAMIEEGSVQPIVEQEYHLAAGVDAFEHYARHPRSKIVITV